MKETIKDVNKIDRRAPSSRTKMKSIDEKDYSSTDNSDWENF